MHCQCERPINSEDRPIKLLETIMDSKKYNVPGKKLFVFAGADVELMVHCLVY